MDKYQNIYLAGMFNTSLTINTTTLTTPSYLDSCFDSQTWTWYPCTKYYDASFIAKYNSNGGLIWANKICETKENGYFSSEPIAVDTSGNCYITGSFVDMLSFNNVPPIMSYNQHKLNTFIAKTDNYGNTIWAKKADGNSTNSDHSFDIKLNNSGNLFIIGNYTDTAIFDSYVLNGTGMFFAKYDTAGNCLMAKKMGYIGNPHSIAFDKFNNYFITGTFRMQANFDSISLTCLGYEDMFITKYSSSGNALWAKQASGDSPNDHNFGYGVAVDSLGDCYVTGSIQDTVHFDSLTFIINDYDVFVAKYNSSGNLVWVKGTGNTGSNNIGGGAVAADNSGSVYVTGAFKGTALFDSISITSANVGDPFIAKLSDNAVGISEFIAEKNSSVVFPNPFSQQATFYCTHVFQNATMTIENIFGQQIKQIKNISGQTITLQRDNLSNGLYFVRLKDDNNIVVTNKIIIIY